MEWMVSEGWLMAEHAGLALLGRGHGYAVDVVVDDEPLLEDSGTVAEAKTKGTPFEVVYNAEKGRLVDRFEPFPAMGKNAWLRTLTYTNTSGNTQDLLRATMRIAPAITPEAAKWNPRYFWMAETAQGGSLCLAYRGSTDFYHIREDESGNPAHVVDSCWRLKPGQHAVIGSQGVWLAQNGREGFRTEAQRWYRAIDLHVPEQEPDWLNDMVLYEFNAGGHIDSRFSDVGGFDRLARQADYLYDLGISAVWLQAVHKHKTPPDPMTGGWNLYDPLDVLEVDAILGGPEALERLIDALHGHGIKVMGEVVPHGGHSIQAQALESWWTYKRDGTPQRNWGGCGMDYSSPEWQEVMRQACVLLAQRYGMIGVRVDVADGSGPNWKSPRTNHASFSTLAGSVEMLEAIRQGLQEGTPDPVILPENFNTAEHFGVTPLGYGHGTWMMLSREIPGMKHDPAAMASRIRDYFEEERGGYPEGARIIRTLNNHDTVAESGRVHLRYGVGLARALYGVCLMTPGIPMMYQEEEIGSFDALRTMNWARRRIPEFATGEPDYFAIDFAPDVFTCLRSHGNAHALGLSNLSGETVSGAVSLPAALNIADGTRVYDGVSGLQWAVEHGAFQIELAPYQTALLRIGQPPAGNMPQPAFPGEALVEPATQEALVVKAAGDGIHVRCGRLIATIEAGPGPWRESKEHNGTIQLDAEYGSIAITPNLAFTITLEQTGPGFTPELAILNADRWSVSGLTALLEDRLLRRHFPFPPEANYTWNKSMTWGARIYTTAPTARLWQSLLEPLHPANPALAFADRDGAVLLLADVYAEPAANIVLTDRTDEGDPDPYGLVLRFHAIDPDLRPDIAAVGLGQPWIVEETAQIGPKQQRVHFRLEEAASGALRALLAAPRRPVERCEARVVHSGGIVKGLHNNAENAIWLVEPGTVTWSHLARVEGKYRIRLELRHSEGSAAGTDLENAYTLTIDGESIPLTWVEHDTSHTGNAYFGYAETPAIDLAVKGRTLSITTSKPWCAIRKGFRLMAGG